MPPMTDKHCDLAIIGGGPAGLMAAELVAQAGFNVHVYDAMPSVGRKFLLAGIGGMNITHSEDYELFISRYKPPKVQLERALNEFTPLQLRSWVEDLGISTFIGSSGRVFPKDMKAAPLLRAWLRRLRESGVMFFPRHRWLGWTTDDSLLIEKQSETNCQQIAITASATLFALGGGSWKKLGSDGRWVDLLKNKHIQIKPLEPSNCGFETSWSQILKQNHAGAILHNIGLSVLASNQKQHTIKSEITISQYGLEGTGMYALSSVLREQINTNNFAQINIDLLPDLSLSHIQQKLETPKGKNSLSNYLRKQLHLSPTKIALIYEKIPKEVMFDNHSFAKAIKQLPIELSAIRPIDEAISTAGGVMFSELNEHLMFKNLPNVFCAGEMIDWDAPTGGYLITGCFATARLAAKGIIDCLKQTTLPKTNATIT